MAKKKQPQETQKKKKDTNKPQQRKLAFGVFLVLLSLYLVFTFSSFFFSWQTDQSGWADLSNREEIADNIGSKIGAYLGQLFVYKFWAGSYLSCVASISLRDETYPEYEKAIAKPLVLGDSVNGIHFNRLRIFGRESYHISRCFGLWTKPFSTRLFGQIGHYTSFGTHSGTLCHFQTKSHYWKVYCFFPKHIL